MRKKIAPQSRKRDIVVQDLKGEVLVYDLELNKAFCLNETLAFVWQACDGNRSIDEISQAVSRKFKQPANEDLVWLALDQLKEENLLENGNEMVSNLNGLSRREAIKKVGLATMIALPIVTGLIAPTAAMAQSVCTGTCTCSQTNPEPVNIQRCQNIQPLGQPAGVVTSGCGTPPGSVCDCRVDPLSNTGTCAP